MQTLVQRICVFALALNMLAGLPGAAAKDRTPDKAAGAESAQGPAKGKQKKQKDQKKDKNKAKNEKGSASAAESKLPPVLWRDPGNIPMLDLVDGIGGKEHAPRDSDQYKFVKEDLNGTNTKFHVEDQNGVRWLVKVGEEASPETAATRFVWAMGYFTDEDYYLPQMHVSGTHAAAPAQPARAAGRNGYGGPARTRGQDRKES